MFNIGDKIIYSAQGICQIDDICEKNFSGAIKKYYVLHPLDNCKLNISIPVDTDKVTMLELMEKDEAEEILETFRQPQKNCLEPGNHRYQAYSQVVRDGNRKEISQIANNLMREKYDIEKSGKKYRQMDLKLLTSIQNILFTEIAMSLNTTYEKVNEEVTFLLKEGIN